MTSLYVYKGCSLAYGVQLGVASFWWLAKQKRTLSAAPEKLCPNNTLERHYEVTENVCKRIWPLLFLKQLKEYSKNPLADIDELYNNRVSYAWNVFGREIKNSIAKSRVLKHQSYFEDGVEANCRRQGSWCAC